MIRLLRENKLDIKSIANQFDCCTRIVYKEQHFLKMAIDFWPINQAAASPNVLQAGGTTMVAGHTSYSASKPLSSLLTKARGGQIHEGFEVRG
jgi:hypothetical protein